MKYISLTQNKKAIVDDEDYDWLNQWKWRYGRSALRWGARPNRKIVYMHRLIMNTPDNLEVDHINGNPLDNRKSNLRNCTHSENLLNKNKQINNTSGHKGVFWHKHSGKWRAQIRHKGIAKHLGYFENKELAAQYYRQAELDIFGKFARSR